MTFAFWNCVIGLLPAGNSLLYKDTISKSSSDRLLMTSLYQSVISFHEEIVEICSTWLTSDSGGINDSSFIGSALFIFQVYCLKSSTCLTTGLMSELKKR